MSYFTERLLNEPNPCTVTRTKLHDMLVAHAAWDYVGEYLAGSYRCRTYKNLGTLNSFGTDWFLTVSWTDSSPGTSSIYFNLSERFDTGTNKMMGIVPASDTHTTPTQANNWGYGTPTTQYSAMASGTNSGLTQYWSTTDMTYWIVVTNSTVMFRSSAANFLFIGGLYTPLITHAEDFPLAGINCGLGDGRYSGGGVTRRPGDTAYSNFTFGLDNSPTSDADRAGAPIGQVPFVADEPWLGGKAIGTPWRLRMYSKSKISTRGEVPNVAVFLQAAEVALGDTLTVDGAQWVCGHDFGSYGVWFNTAAV